MRKRVLHGAGLVNLEHEREMRSLRDQLAKARTLLRNMLDAPYAGMTAWAATDACIWLGHPERKDGRCYCRSAS